MKNIENTRGSLLMVLAMLAFAFEDMFIKGATRSLPIGEILVIFGLGGTLAFVGLTRQRGQRVFHPAILSRTLILRAISEILGRLMFVFAIAFTPLSSASAILQATPLVVALGAVVFFGEVVRWQRWLAICAGFGGVLLILRPGLAGFEATSLFAVVATIGFAGRDLATRAAPKVLSNMQLGIYGFFVMIPTGLVLMAFTGPPKWPTPEQSGLLGGAIVVGVIAYYALTAAMRAGEVSVVAPFRYTRLIFAMLLGIVVFSERPDALTVLGSAIIVVSGLYTVLQTRKSTR